MSTEKRCPSMSQKHLPDLPRQRCCAWRWTTHRSWASRCNRQKHCSATSAGPRAPRNPRSCTPGTWRVFATCRALTSGDNVEEALSRVLRHRDADTSQAPAMAVRLHRWLATAEDTSTSLGADLQRQMNDGAWVDAAVGAVRGTAQLIRLSPRHTSICSTRCKVRRKQRDAAAASRLDQVNGTGESRVVGVPSGCWPKLSIPGGVKAARCSSLDGMSSAIATALAPEECPG